MQRGPRRSLAALSAADAIVIGPSDPAISIGPNLGIRGSARRRRLAVPLVAVSPSSPGCRAVKGRTHALMALRAARDRRRVASIYQGLLDGVVRDAGDPELLPEGLSRPLCPTLMEGSGGRRALADRTPELVASLSR